MRCIFLPLAGTVLLAGCQTGLGPKDDTAPVARLSAADGSPTPYLSRAETHLRLGNYAAAIIDAGEARHMATRQGQLGEGGQLRILRSLGLLALAHALAGDLAQSRVYLKLLEELPGDGSSGFWQAKHRIVARVHMAHKEFAVALDALGRERGDSVQTLVDGAVGSGEIETREELPRLYMIAKCLLETGRSDEAKQILDRLLKSPHMPGLGEIYWLTLFDRGRIADRKGEIMAALGFYASAVEVIERWSETARNSTDMIGFAGEQQKVYSALIRLLVRGGEAASAFEYAARSNSLGEVVAASRDVNAASPDPATLISVTFLAADEAKSLLAPGEALIVYHQIDNELIAFVATDRDLHAIPLYVSDLDQEVRVFRKQLAVVNSVEYISQARRLHEKLIQPITDRPDSGPLTIIARGALRDLPFAALHDGQSYLVDRHALRILSNTEALRQPVEELIGLWPGDDAASSYLKKRYRENLRFDDQREALHQAQIATMKRYTHPYYWAGFQVGDARRMNEDRVLGGTGSAGALPIQ